ncbi:MAG: LemA family protein [Planctomycetota bacterium]
MGKFLGLLLVAAIVIGGLAVTTYNGLVGSDESVSSAWSKIESEYKRRSDLIPQLVETVKGAADYEESVLTEVTEARAKVNQIQVQLPEDGPVDQAMLDQYMKAQSELGAGLGRLIATAEAYPDIKATEAFLDLQNQLEGTENRIAVARTDYIETVKTYNTRVRKFPANLVAGMMGFETKAQMQFEEGIDAVPTIDFGTND